MNWLGRLDPQLLGTLISLAIVAALAVLVRGCSA